MRARWRADAANASAQIGYSARLRSSITVPARSVSSAAGSQSSCSIAIIAACARHSDVMLGARRGAQIRAFLEQRRGAGAVAGQMERGAAEEQARSDATGCPRGSRSQARSAASPIAPSRLATDHRFDAGEPRASSERRRSGASPGPGRRRRHGEVACLGRVPGRQEAVCGRERERRVAGELLAS